jgi:hypothetical protein
MQREQEVEEKKKEELGNFSNEVEDKTTDQRKSKTRNYMEGVDQKNKHHFSLKKIIVGVVSASVFVLVIELIIRGIL